MVGERGPWGRTPRGGTETMDLRFGTLDYT